MNTLLHEIPEIKNYDSIRKRCTYFFEEKLGFEKISLLLFMKRSPHGTLNINKYPNLLHHFRMGAEFVSRDHALVSQYFEKKNPVYVSELESLGDFVCPLYIGSKDTIIGFFVLKK